MNKVVPNTRSLMAAVSLAAAVLMMPQGAQGQGGPHSGIQEQIDALKTQNETILSVLCAQNPVINQFCNALIVFVTSSDHLGDLAEGGGGVAGGDEICRLRALEANLAGTYFAWLSDDTVSPSTRFARKDLPYWRPDVVLVANDFADLTDGELIEPISVDETGTLLDGFEAVWTGTLSNGESSEFNCNGWTSGTDAFGGRIGVAGDTGPSWSQEHPNTTCDADIPGYRLYCFQQ